MSVQSNLPTNELQALPLDEFLTSCRERSNLALQRALYLPAHTGTLSDAMTYACLNGGKRIRPVLVYATALAVDASLDTADVPATAVELIHSYSLAHDDLPAMDDDDLRRGKPSLHKAFDEATAVLVGDALQSLAFELLTQPADIEPNTRLRMIAELGTATGAQGMVGGQALDFALVGKQTSIAELESMHRLKTGALIRASVTLGALCKPNLDPEVLASLQQYAQAIGLAFQVQDDVLDEASDTETLGKPQGSDRLNNKPTYVSLLGMDGAQAKAQELTEQALAAIEGLPAKADQLRNLASFIVNRTH